MITIVATRTTITTKTTTSTITKTTRKEEEETLTNIAMIIDKYRNNEKNGNNDNLKY